MKKIIGFDSWTLGIENYKRIAESLRDKGFELEILHLGSWGSDPNRPKEETIGGIRVRDISYFLNSDFMSIIKSVSPDAVIFLSTETFAHRAFNRYCMINQVPTLHLFHGVVSVQAVDQDNHISVTYKKQLILVLERLNKMFTKVFPAYIKSMIRCRAGFDEWVRFVYDLYAFGFGRYVKTGAADAKTKKCAVYVEGDREYAINRFGYSPEDVYVVGNPDLLRFNLIDSDIGIGLNKDLTNDSLITYIDSAFVCSGWLFANVEEYVDYLVKLKVQVESQGKEFAVKLHPAHSKTGLLELLGGLKFRIVSNSNFIDSIKRSVAVICEPSSAAIIPALMAKPLLLNRFSQFREQQYGKMLVEYPLSSYFYDSTVIDVEVNNSRGRCSDQDVRKWIHKYSGPLPSADMPERVANLVCGLVA